jgi:hypothetical protein
MAEEPYIVTKLKESIDDWRTGIDDFSGHALECPFYEDNYCMAHNITTMCDIASCPVEDMNPEDFR